MNFKQHPIFDYSNASDWFELGDDAEPLTQEAKPFANLIRVYREHQQYIAVKVLEYVKRHVDQETLLLKPNVLRNEVLFAPLGDHGFQLYYQFYFLEHTDHAPADNDFWWAIILCAYVFDERFGPDRKRHWNVAHFGWSVE
jgi:hypothetical protein